MVKTLIDPRGGRSATPPVRSRASVAQDLIGYCNAVMEPWDGPAAIAATDGTWIIDCGMDRNGLRPMRYSLSAATGC